MASDWQMKRMPSLEWGPRLSVDSKLMTRATLNSSALVVHPLLHSLQLREMPARDVHLHSTVDLLLPWVLLDNLDVERLLHRSLLGRGHHQSPAR